MSVNIRMATKEDAANILKIYVPYVLETDISFEITAPSLSEFEGRIENILKGYPYVVCERDGVLIGYAYAQRQRAREAYDWNAELSVYVDEKYHGRGIGKALYNAVMDVLKLQNMKTVYGAVAIPNERSNRLHESLGFSVLGIFHKTGFKHGKWHDVMWFEKKIGEYDVNPSKVKTLGELDTVELEEVFDNAIKSIMGK